MIVVKEIKLDPQTKQADVSLFSDTKNEVIPSATIQGFPAGYSIAVGSSVLTGDGDMAFMKSTGWSWV